MSQPKDQSETLPDTEMDGSEPKNQPVQGNGYRSEQVHDLGPRTAEEYGDGQAS